MRSAFTITGVELRRFMRDRSNIFFIFIFPLLLVFFLGLQFGEGSAQSRVAVSGPETALQEAVVNGLEAEDVDVSRTDEEALREQLARGRTEVGLLVPGSAANAFEAGEDVELEVLTGPQAGAQAGVQNVASVLQQVSSEEGQVAALTAEGANEDDARAALADAEATVEPPSVQVVDVSAIAQEFSGIGQFDVGAAQQLLLFVFLISLAGSATLIQSRRYGIVGRTLAAPISTAQVIGGQALGRFTIALFQGAYIMLGTTLLFGVDWGNIGLSVLVLALFSVVAAAAAMVIGSVMDNDNAASGVGVGVGLVFAGLGGAMLPLELFPDSLLTVSKFTPHAWAYEAFAGVQRHDAGLIDILPQLGVLAAMAAVLLALGAWTLRRSLARAI